MKNSEFRDYVVHDLLSEIFGVTSKRMFGGFGLYKNGVIFGIIAENEFYFKIDEAAHADFEKYGSRQFTYEKQGKIIALKFYWLVTEEMMEDVEDTRFWLSKNNFKTISSK